MGRHKGDNGEYEFTRAAHDELRDAEKQYGVRFSLALEPGEQKGVFLLCIGAVKPDGSDGLVYAARWQGSWPNSVAQSYGAFLYAATHRVVRMVEAWYAHESSTAPENKPRG